MWLSLKSKYRKLDDIKLENSLLHAFIDLLEQHLTLDKISELQSLRNKIYLLTTVGEINKYCVQYGRQLLDNIPKSLGIITQIIYDVKTIEAGFNEEYELRQETKKQTIY